MKQYWDIKSKYPDMILLFRLGDFYEMFADDAVKAAPVLEVSLTHRLDLPMCGVPYHAVNHYIRKLINHGFKAAICDQLEEASAAKGIVKRGVTSVVTPGTVIEDILLDTSENNFLFAIAFDKDCLKVAIAAADISTGDFFASSCDLKRLNSEIEKYNPKEIIIASKNANAKIITELSQKQKTITEISDMYFDYDRAMSILDENFGQGAANRFAIDDKTAVSVCAAALSYIKETQGAKSGIFSYIKYIRSGEFMYLDPSAERNLELTASLTNGKSDNSLLSILDCAKTPMGKRALRQWLIKPLLDIAQIKDRQNRVSFFLEDSFLRQEIIDILKSIGDIERITARIIFASAMPRDLISLKESLKSANEIAVRLKDFIRLDTQSNQSIIDTISSAIMDDPPNTLKDGGVIKNGFNPELDELRKISSDVKSFMSDLENEERKKTGIANLKIGYTSVFGYYIEITKSNLSNVPQHYIRKQTVANGERYITPELKEFEEKILSAQEKILRLENHLFANLKQTLSDFSVDILKTARIIAEIDVFSSFAQNAISYNYCRPDIDDSKELSIVEGRHPVVERILKDGEFAANDIDFNQDSRILLLTGPNMSGKSTYLRQTALIVIMAQIGSFVPAKSARIGIVDRIFTRIGAGDNLAGGQSTFMVEMMETADILNQYTDRSLIILDEVGRGTSTYDGMSIAWAILEYLGDEKRAANKGSKILFATHYFELTSLSKKLNGMNNFSVEIKEWNGQVIFLHRIIKGSADKSYGIHVAKIAGLPSQVIQRAFKILDNLENNQIDPQKEGDIVQQDLFAPQPHFILTALEALDIDNLTPIQAIALLTQWKEQYKA
ncbi:MAG: DNA mismatch repair protein MutS [Elusimicrobiota bacterium]|jgi:DNA mismatch repair protein MutS|nr:DNA mismatch repair protein MutS [Elusimicrobiota bacterium]